MQMEFWESPERAGVESRGIAALLRALDARKNTHSLVLLRHGKTVFECAWSPHDPDGPHSMFSVSKSFTSAAVGLAEAEGLLSIDDRVAGFFGEIPEAELSPGAREMRIRDALCMTTGHREDTLSALIASAGGGWPRAFFGQPVEEKPGTHFVYNTGATYMCADILQRAAGVPLDEYLRERLFSPLGIEYSWRRNPDGVCLGGWGLSISARSLAKFGELCLKKGIRGSRRLLPGGWVERATARHIGGDAPSQSDWEQGYGYQFWRCRHGCYRADGAFGQFCVVMPRQDAVLAITAGENEAHRTLNAVWRHLLPAMKDAPLPEDDRAHTALRELAASLDRADFPPGEPRMPGEESFAGRYGMWLPAAEAEEELRFTEDEVLYRMQTKTGPFEYRFPRERAAHAGAVCTPLRRALLAYAYAVLRRRGRNDARLQPEPLFL